jgi:hypothetical protein
MRNLEKCPECLHRFHVEWQGKQNTTKLLTSFTCSGNQIIIEIFVAKFCSKNLQFKFYLFYPYVTEAHWFLVLFTFVFVTSEL